MGSGKPAGRPAVRGPTPVPDGAITSHCSGGVPLTHNVAWVSVTAHSKSAKAILWPAGNSAAAPPLDFTNSGLAVARSPRWD